MLRATSVVPLKVSVVGVMLEWWKGLSVMVFKFSRNPTTRTSPIAGALRVSLRLNTTTRRSCQRHVGLEYVK